MSRAREVAIAWASSREKGRCDAIQQVLHDVHWNKSKAAARLGLSRTKLYVRLRRQPPAA